MESSLGGGGYTKSFTATIASRYQQRRLTDIHSAGLDWVGGLHCGAFDMESRDSDSGLDIRMKHVAVPASQIKDPAHSKTVASIQNLPTFEVQVSNFMLCPFHFLSQQRASAPFRCITDKAVMNQIQIQIIRGSVSLRYGQGCDDWFVYSNYKKLAFVALRTRLW